MESIKDILSKIQKDDSGKYLKYEWQLYAYKLAEFLDDMQRVSMYMKLAKNVDRDILQKALDFVKDSNARSKPKLFLWKLGQLREENKPKK